MSRCLARYTASRRFLSVTLFAFASGAFSAWVGLHWWPAWIPAAIFLASTVGLAMITIRPAIEIYDTHLAIGRRNVSWAEVRAVDQTRWARPLVMHLTLSGGERIRIVYPGDLDAVNGLRRHLHQFSRRALIDGIPYRQYWGNPPASEQKQKRSDPAPARYPVLRPEDEEEVERMFQRLKTAGKIDARSTDDN